MTTPLFTGYDWDIPTINRTWDAIEEIAIGELGLDMFPNKIEIISSEQMLDAYSSHGLPHMYKHWSFGKRFVKDHHDYKTGRSGLAYEIVINSNPCINYLMADNSMLMQALVMAHAGAGHNSFFKNNYLFREWTDAGAILSYVKFAANYVHECEQRHGVRAVEDWLDACHVWSMWGVDKYQRRRKQLGEELSLAESRAREERERLAVHEFDRIMPTKSAAEVLASSSDVWLAEGEENVLYFIEKNAPGLKGWQRELIRITRTLAQYFAPQIQTKVMNEGWASFCHYYIMTRLNDKGLLNDGHYLEFLTSHTAVVRQPKHQAYNPYYLGFNMFMDLKRMCEKPTDEDRKWFPEYVDTDWKETLRWAAYNFRDESFVRQFLSPKLMRDERMILIGDNSANPKYVVKDIHDEEGYRRVRRSLADQYLLDNLISDIRVVGADLAGDRTLYLTHYVKDSQALTDEDECIDALQVLWNGYPVSLDSVDPNDLVALEINKG